jgi:putative transcriptional regulator
MPVKANNKTNGNQKPASSPIQPAHFFVPKDVDLLSIRKKTGLKQQDFASSFGFPLYVVRELEAKLYRPTSYLRAYLTIIDRNPQLVLDLLQEESDI